MKHIVMDISSCMQCPFCLYSKTFKHHYCNPIKGHFRDKRVETTTDSVRPDCPLPDTEEVA